eukprot:1770696-Pyramimonas_sp.AAC.1
MTRALVAEHMQAESSTPPENYHWTLVHLPGDGGASGEVRGLRKAYLAVVVLSSSRYRQPILISPACKFDRDVEGLIGALQALSVDGNTEFESPLLVGVDAGEVKRLLQAGEPLPLLTNVLVP